MIYLKQFGMYSFTISKVQLIFRKLAYFIVLLRCNSRSPICQKAGMKRKQIYMYKHLLLIIYLCPSTYGEGGLY